ncbi:MAG: sialate O-acetylesterase [Bacteroidales bacterium]|nr:sialate O-acetylesterase [Bacteroidales bacterium]
MKKSFLLFVPALLICVAAQAKITLPSVLSDNMVLQQQTEVSIWGKTDSGNTVKVCPGWTRTKYIVDPDADGKWSVKVKTPAAGFTPYEIKISDGDDITLKNVLIGEVWFCSGQSNMEMPMKGYPSQPTEGATDFIIGAKTSRPLRICNIRKCSSTTVVEKTEGSWNEHTPEIVAGTSATAYFFADFLQKQLDVPVGILISSWGGSTIETWLDRETIEEKFPGEFDLFYLGQPWDKKYAKKDHQWPCLLYNGQIAPLVPFTFKGMIWYQGESNRGREEQYIRLMQAYANMMRTKFQVPDAPYYFVQIAPYGYKSSHGDNSYASGFMYEAQQKAAEIIPHSGMAVTVDIGARNTIHPFKKREVGMRLAMLALANDYGVKGFNPNAPTFAGMEVKDGAAFISFNNAELGLSPMAMQLDGFEIAGADKKFIPAQAILSNPRNVVKVWSEEIPEPVAVRYCFRNWCVGSVFNNYGIPVAPFRTDNWSKEEVPN